MNNGANIAIAEQDLLFNHFKDAQKNPFWTLNVNIEDLLKDKHLQKYII